MLKDQIQQWVNKNQLLNISLIKPKDNKNVIWGRIIKFDEDENILLIYHVDEKKTYQVALNEIEDISPSNNIKKIDLKNIANDVNNLKQENIPKNTATHHFVYDKAQKLLESLSIEELLAIMPLLQYLSKMSMDKNNN